MHLLPIRINVLMLTDIIYNYEKERDTRHYDNDEFSGRIKIAYRPKDIGTFNERLINEDILKR